MRAKLALLLEPVTLSLLAVMLLATVLPCRGAAAQWLDWATDAAIALLFFLHGAKLSREALIAGIAHWRLHLFVQICTFALFPLLGVALRPLLEPLLGAPLTLGLLFLCVLPSTVQSSVAFTAIAHGNVAAAACSAAFSSVIGIFLSPLLTGAMIHAQNPGVASGSALASIGKVLLQLAVPFALGQLARSLVGAWIERHRRVVGLFDYGSILLIVYTAFSAAVVEGLWRHISPLQLLALLLICGALLAIALCGTAWLGRRLGFSRADCIAIQFCGSKKSLANGVPMANVMFSSASLGTMLLPTMMFHQLQLMVCAAMAQHYARRAASARLVE